MLMCIFIYSSSVLSLQNVMLEHVIYEMYVNDTLMQKVF